MLFGQKRLGIQAVSSRGNESFVQPSEQADSKERLIARENASTIRVEPSVINYRWIPIQLN